MAADAQLGHASRQGLCPKRAAVVSHYTEPPAGSTTVCTDELGPVVPRAFDPAPSWSPTGHRVKAPLDYERGPEKTWGYGALRIRDGKELTRCAASRNSTNYIALLQDIEADNPTGDIFIITDNLSSHNSAQTRAWMAEHPRLQHVFIPTGACWLNLQEGWWQVFLTAAGMIAFINSMLVGVFAGLLLAVFTLPLLVCTSAGVITFLVSFGILQRYQWLHWRRLEQKLTVLFSSQPL